MSPIARLALPILALAALLALAACGCRTCSGPPPDASGRAAPVTHPRFGDHDPHDWNGRAPHHYAVHGLDVAKYQGEIDWAAARAAGISFAFIKATEGGDRVDEMFRDHWRAAGRAGVPRGAYHFFYWCRPATEQARWFMRHVPRDRNALPHVLDMEWTPFSPTCRIRPEPEVVRREAETFLRMLELHYGRRPILYTSIDFYEDTGIGDLPRTEFWLRSVAGHPSDTYPRGARWTLWQYTGTGQVPGVRGGVDINVFRGSLEDWMRWAGQG